MGNRYASFVLSLAHGVSHIHPLHILSASDQVLTPASFCCTASAASERAMTAQNSCILKSSADHILYNRNLMAPDSFRNLGFGDDSDGPPPASKTVTATPSQQQPTSLAKDKPSS